MILTFYIQGAYYTSLLQRTSLCVVSIGSVSNQHATGRHRTACPELLRSPNLEAKQQEMVSCDTCGTCPARNLRLEDVVELFVYSFF